MPSVLVTGAARGIGRATVLRLAASGWDVVAGVRRAEDGDALKAAQAGRVNAVTLDVTDEDQVATLEGVLPERLDAVVNNAGVFAASPLETTLAAELRRQLEVNVVGQLAVTQAVLPRLREQRGRVVFVSSVSGRIATPMFGAYCASKFALEGMADALRMELAPWGVRVVLVEPAQTNTDVWRGAVDAFDDAVEAMTAQHRELYAKHVAGYRRTIPLSQRLAASVDGVAATIEKALTARRPRARYVVGASAKLQVALGLLTPATIRDRVLRVGAGVPGRP